MTADRPKPAMMLRTLSLLLAAAALAACGEAAKPTPAPPAPVLQGQRMTYVPDHPQLKLLPLVRAEPAPPLQVEMPARFVWNEERTQRIYVPYAGRVMDIRADVGHAVKPGTPLAKLASPEFATAQSDAVRAQADERMARQHLQRQRELFEAGIVARKELEQAQTEAERALAELQRALARTRLYGAEGPVDQQLVIRAAIAGVVVERNINPGQELRPEQAGPGVPPLFVISDPSSLWVWIDVRETDSSIVHAAQSVKLRVPSLENREVQGRVVAMADAIDPQTRTIKVRAVVANPKRELKAEMLATAVFEKTYPGGLRLPASAVVQQGNRHWVFVQPAPAQFELRPIRLAHEGGREVIVSEGLQPGESVVADNVLLLARLFRLAQAEAAPPVAGAQKP